MKNFVKWGVRILLLILLVVCTDMNFNRTKLSAGNQNLMEVINIITAIVLLIFIVQIFGSKKSAKKRE